MRTTTLSLMMAGLIAGGTLRVTLAHSDGLATGASSIRNKAGAVQAAMQKGARVDAKTLAELFFQGGDYRESAKYGKKYLRNRPDDADVAAVLSDSYLQLEDYTAAAATMTHAVQHKEAIDKRPQESWLRIAQSAYHGMGDVQDESLMLQKLVHYYHRAEDWRALLSLTSRNFKDERLKFGFLRLQYDLGLLEAPVRYEALIFDYSAAGMLSRASVVLEDGEASGVLSVNRAERLRHAIKVRGFNSQRRLSHAINEAKSDPSGKSDAWAGQIYFGEGRYAQAIQMFRAALKKGGLSNPDETRINLGIACIRNHQLADAHAAFDQVTARSDWSTLATLWSLRLESETLEFNS